MAIYLVPIDNGRPIVLDKAVVFVGRHPECDVILKDSRKVSRKHCCLAQVDDRIVVRDLGSMNGIRVNGRQVRKETTIHLNDELSIGDVTYRIKSRRQMLDGMQSGDVEQLSEPSPRKPASPPPSPLIRAINEGDVDISQDFPVPLSDSLANESELPSRFVDGRSSEPSE
ncbi:FHA domain-containing protein [Thalassoroseus pseudoceratinae]|uniref:FHA domain-containing protein n=1 Tax=Thalassoroseus pseudoceratinae TaxID=2713176 RepID=UPI001420B733|nr:FHA domain-containing protein [Thalassoroseus pseudoceratinae]